MDASQITVRWTLTELKDNGKGTVVAALSKEQSPTEYNKMADTQDLLALVEFLNWYSRYFERSAFEIITDKKW